MFIKNLFITAFLLLAFMAAPNITQSQDKSEHPLIVVDETYNNYEGYDKAGYDTDGYDRYGYNREGYNRKGYQKEKYNENGNNTWTPKDNKNQPGYDGGYENTSSGNGNWNPANWNDENSKYRNQR